MTLTLDAPVGYDEHMVSAACSNRPSRGGIAQLGERGVRNAEVAGSSPAISTNPFQVPQAEWPRGASPAYPRRGFYHLCDGDLEFEPLIQALLAWEGVYNTLCPHHSLGGLTPAEYLHHYDPDLLATAVSHMY